MFMYVPTPRQHGQVVYYCGQRSDAGYDLWTRCTDSSGERTQVSHPLPDGTSGSFCGVWACPKCQEHMRTSRDHRHSAVRRMMVDFWRAGGHRRASASASSEESSEEKAEESTTCSHDYEMSDPVHLGEKVLIVSLCKKCGDMKKLVVG